MEEDLVEECKKCGSMKIESVHHCSKCKSCVYKMDHHCPWTDNCVGYFTVKPFLLFLFYVTALCFITTIWMYAIAWKQGMRHISLFQLMIVGSKRDAMISYFLPEDERKTYIKE